MAVQIPMNGDIREYKEKILLGLTARQLLSVAILLFICIPFYVFGQKFLHEEIVAWITIFIAMPVGAIGFVPFHGMPFEKFMVVFIKSRLSPARRLYKTDNEIRHVQSDFYEKRKKIDRKRNLEETYFLKEMMDQGVDYYWSPDGCDFLLSKDKTGKKGKKDKNMPKQNRKSKVEIKGEYIRSKMNKNPDYKLTPDDKKALREYEQFLKERLVNEKVVKEKKNRLEIEAEMIQDKQYKNPLYKLTKKEEKILLDYAKYVKKKREKQIAAGKKRVSNSVKSMEQRKKAKTRLPKSAQDTVPYCTDYDNGLFEIEPGIYSKTYTFEDIGYRDKDDSQRIGIITNWSTLFGGFDETFNLSVSIDNHIISKEEQERDILYQMAGNEDDIHRREFNRILKGNLNIRKTPIKKNRYFTISFQAGNPYEAQLKFEKLDKTIKDKFSLLNTKVKLQSTDERLEFLHDIYRPGREGLLNITYSQLQKMGLSSKDYIAPSSFDDMHEKDHMRIGNQYYRCMYLSNVPEYLTDEFFTDLTDMDFSLIGTLNIVSLSKNKAIEMTRRQLAGMEANIIKAQGKASENNYSSSIMSHDLKQAYDKGTDFLEDLLNRNQGAFFVNLGIMVKGETLEMLENNCEQIIRKASEYACQMQCYDYNQENAMKCILPLGHFLYNRLFTDKIFTTERTAVFIPFMSKEIQHKNGIYMGLNQKTKTLQMVDRTKLVQPSGFVIGSSGFGKSFAVKREILNVLLKDSVTPIIIIDPDNEYSSLCRMFKGTVIKLAPESETYINPFDMDVNYGLEDDDDPDTMPMDLKKKKALVKKIEFLMTIIRCALYQDDLKASLTGKQKSVCDTVITNVYKEFLDHDFDPAYVPDFTMFQKELELMAKENETAKDMAEEIKYFTVGTMSIFSHKTNVDYNSRFVVFNTKSMGKENMAAILIIMDLVWNRACKNVLFSIFTRFYIDEVHTLLRSEMATDYLHQYYKRGRKFGLIVTSITQNVESIEDNEKAKEMIANSEYIYALKQKEADLDVLTELKHLTENQFDYIYKAGVGQALLFLENEIIMVEDKFPDDSYLYKIITTKFGENTTDAEIVEFMERLTKEMDEERIA